MGNTASVKPRKSSRKKRIAIFIIVVLILASPFFHALYCEVVTFFNMNDISSAIKDYDDYVSAGWKFKVIEIDANTAKVYRYIISDDLRRGETRRFIKDDGEWKKLDGEKWEGEWSFKKNQFIPQYWWHAFYLWN